MPLLINVKKLSIINELMDVGASTVASSVSSLAGAETTVEIQSLSFTDPDDLPAQMGDDESYVASIQLTEPPYGVFMLTFSRPTAEAVARLLSGEPVAGELSEFQQSALQEMCNICTSGFIDGVANTLETSIDMDSPTLSREGDAAVRTQLTHVRKESIAIVLDSVIGVPDEETEIELGVYFVPSPGSFVNLLDSIELDGPDSQSARAPQP